MDDTVLLSIHLSVENARFGEVFRQLVVRSIFYVYVEVGMVMKGTLLIPLDRLSHDRDCGRSPMLEHCICDCQFSIVFPQGL